MTDKLITTSEVADMLGLDRRSIGARVRRGSMNPAPAFKLPGTTGAYLFELSEVKRVANEKATEK